MSGEMSTLAQAAGKVFGEESAFVDGVRTLLPQLYIGDQKPEHVLTL